MGKTLEVGWLVASEWQIREERQCICYLRYCFVTEVKLKLGLNSQGLLWAYHEKARISEKDNNAGKGGKQKEKRKTKYEMD